MDKSRVLFGLSIIFFAAILFTPLGTNYWIYLLIFGIIFGIFWWMSK